MIHPDFFYNHYFFFLFLKTTNTTTPAAIITGDITQIDLPISQKSGLIDAMQVLKSVKGISKIEFNIKDIVRHKLVQQIVEAYNKAEKKKIR